MSTNETVPPITAEVTNAATYCKPCKRQFKNALAYRMHVIRSHGKKKWASIPAGAKRTKGTAKAVKLKSTGKTACPLCPRKFKNALGLSIHMGTAHKSDSTPSVTLTTTPLIIKGESDRAVRESHLSTDDIHVAFLAGAVYENIRLYCEGNSLLAKPIASRVAAYVLSATKR